MRVLKELHYSRFCNLLLWERERERERLRERNRDWEGKREMKIEKDKFSERERHRVIESYRLTKSDLKYWYYVTE